MLKPNIDYKKFFKAQNQGSNVIVEKNRDYHELNMSVIAIILVNDLDGL
jgi:hypothetical protein